MKTKPSNTVYISNLSYTRDRYGVKSLVSKYGKIKYIKIVVDPKTLVSRGMAFVQMDSVEEATLAIKELDGRKVDGRTIKANFAAEPLKEPQRMDDGIALDPEKQSIKKPLKDDLRSYKAGQLVKKAKNLAKRNSNPLKFKASKKTV